MRRRRSTARWSAIAIYIGVAFGIAGRCFGQHTVPPFLAARLAENRGRVPPPKRRAIDAALAWLVAHQDDDGHWDCDGFTKHDPEDGSVTKGTIDLYYWYHGSNAMRHYGGADRTRWEKALSRALVEHQRDDGSAADGSWDPVSVWSVHGGRIYSTAMATLCLQASYRIGEIEALIPLPDTKVFRKPRKLWGKGQFGGADAALRGMDTSVLTERERAAHASALAELEYKAKLALRRVDSMREGPDYLSAQVELEVVEKTFRGLDPGKRAADSLRAFRSSKTIRAEVKAMTRYRAVIGRYEVIDRSTHDKLGSALRGVTSKYPGTLGARKARTILDRWGL